MRSASRRILSALGPTTSTKLLSTSSQPPTRARFPSRTTNALRIQKRGFVFGPIKPLTPNDVWEAMQIRRQIAKKTVNKYSFDRVAALGPDLACLEWLMNCGATEVRMSDGTSITTQKQMRDFISHCGLDLSNLKPLSPDLKPPTDEELHRLTRLQGLYNQRWSAAPSVHIVEVDASDSAIVDPGFNYFLETRRIQKLVLNFCDFFYNNAVRIMVKGRLQTTLTELEVCFNGHITELAFQYMTDLQALRKAHFYMNPWIRSEQRMRTLLQNAIPRLQVTYPEMKFVGLGKHLDGMGKERTNEK